MGGVARTWASCLLVVLALAGAAGARADEAVVLQLKWSHGFQFAGYYAAEAQGYYREAGLQVELREGRADIDVIDEVVSGRAHYGVGTSGLLLARQRGAPVVALAAIFQHSPQILLVRRDHDTQSVHDLVGKRLMIEPMAEELLAMLKQLQIHTGTLQLQPHTFRLDELRQGKVDGLSAYSTNEPYWLDEVRFPYQIITPRSVGIDFYGDNLFTSEAELQRHPQRVERFRAASLRGWAYAMAHPEAIIELIRARQPGRHSLDYLQFEADQTASLVRADLIEIGYMNPQRWRHIADVYADTGAIPPALPLDGFLYRTPGDVDLDALKTSLAIALAVSLGVAAVAWYIHRINRRLRLTLAEGARVQATLAESESRFRALAETAAGVLVVRGTQVILSNHQIGEITGYSEAEMRAMNEIELIHPDDRERVVGYSLARQRGEPAPMRYEARFLRKDGQTRWAEVTAAPALYEGQPCSIGTVYDITERKQIEARIARMAQYDALTELPNRALLQDRLCQALVLAERKQLALALMFVDLDKFKPVNDLHGHAAGDALLKAVARRVEACLRHSDTVARIGGDEYIVLLQLEHTDDAVAVAEKIREVLSRPFDLEQGRVNISATVGVALYPDHGRDETSLLRCADAAMYRAKEAGRNCVVVYDASLIAAPARN